MALTPILLMGAALLLTFFSGSEAGEAGVCWGMKGNDLMQPPDVVRLLQANGIGMVRLYDADAGALRALAKTRIKVGVSLPNGNLGDAGNMLYAQQWVQENVKAYYPDTQINSVAVGNEVFHQVPQSTPLLLPAMRNIQAALENAGLASAVKVITPIALDALKEPSFPPSKGEFKDELAQVMSSMIDFLRKTGSYLSFNIYPYFAYKQDPSIDLNYVLFLPNDGKPDSGTGLVYQNMFDAMTDAVFHAVEKLSSSRKDTPGRKMLQADYDLLEMKIQESGLPAPPKHRVANAGALKHDASDSVGCISCQKSVEAATAENAQTYNSNLISKVLRGTGTPYKPNARISVYIFSLFNENMKTGEEEEKYFGLFYPNGTPVYKVNFIHPVPSPGPRDSWCTANAAVGDKRLQAALDYACGHGADCSAIQPGQSCYQPNTVVAHASYAFDSYYQKNRRASVACDFAGAGTVVYQKPESCGGNGASWCVANQAVGDARLQTALDYACSHGADCNAIQTGGRCFEPNTKVAHASYAFNSYYQQNQRSDQACYFGGSGKVVHQRPQFGNCLF